jgi:hypothetical protein
MKEGAIIFLSVFTSLKKLDSSGVVAYAYSPSPWEGEA